jgi:hypothetical protein
MFTSLARKTRQVAADPVLRKWLVRRLTGGAASPSPFAAHRPPYLNGVPGPDSQDTQPQAPPEAFEPLGTKTPAEPPVESIELPLPGLTLRLEPGAEKDVFTRSYGDMETLLALHRFAWVPLLETFDANAAAWTQALWDVWRRSFSRPGKDWAWHPYTAAERAINLLDLARIHGLPGPVDETVSLLADHATEIHRRLEYFGDHDTSNHLSNNGRGLFRIGLALGLNWAARAGAEILDREAARIFMPSGVLREGSSHYHLLVARNYADAWLAALRHGRPEEEAFLIITRKALAVVPWLILPGGMPLVGDISPDCPPEHLLGLAGLESGWVAGLGDDDRAAILAQIEKTRPADNEELAQDGWLRFSRGPWSGLWHTAPGGWPQAPGHGHQDTGGFELHFDGTPVFVDPGRGAYGEDGEAAHYRSSLVHNTVTVDGTDPYPNNKPYYDDAFRRDIAGPAPELNGGGDEVVLGHHGFGRFKGLGSLRRQWRFTNDAMTLTDTLEGDGRHLVTRRFATPLEAEAGAGGVVLKGGGRTFHLNSPDASAAVREITLWRAYGSGRLGSLIEFTTEAQLPWTGEIRLEVL